MKLGGIDSLRGADIFFGNKSSPYLPLEHVALSWVKQPQREAYCSFPFSAMIRNLWEFILNPVMGLCVMHLSPRQV